VSHIQSLRPQSTTPIIAAALVLTASSLALAQSAPTSGGLAAPPAREGNIYDHKDHQPTEAEVRAAERAAGTASPSSGTKQQVEDEVRELLQQTDRLDKQSEQQEQDYPSGSSSGPKDGR
jgi:hypothetical protein